MSFDIIWMEIKRMRKTLFMALLAPAGYSALIMVFYIAFAGVFDEMQGLFDNASLQGLLKAFSMDTNTFSYILNYYVAYSGVYVTIMGIVFASSIAVKMFSGELKEGTYEFLYANPLSRFKIFVSKSMVMILYLVALNLLVFLVGLVSIELLKTNSPLMAWMSDDNVSLLVERAEEDPSRLSVFERDETLFYELMYGTLENQFVEFSEVQVDDALISELMTAFLLDPDSVFDVMLASPETYMPLFGKVAGQEGEFEYLVKAQRDQYLLTKEGFINNDLMALSFFKMNPKAFVEKIIDEEHLDAFKEGFDLSQNEYDKIIIYYSLGNFVKLSITTFMAMLTIAMFIMMFVLIIPGGKMSTGIASGIAFFFYLINMMANIAEPIHFMRYVTPLSYINMDVMSLNYKTSAWSWWVMVITIILSYLISLWSIRKSDLIAG